MKAVLFDLDGTLVDTIDDIARVCNHVLHKYGIPPMSVQTYTPWVGRGLRKLLLSVLERHQIEEKTEVIFSQILAEYVRAPVVSSVVFSGIKDVLSQFSQRSIPIAVLSNKEQELVEQVVRELLPESDFFTLRGNNSSFPTKPNPRQALDIAQEVDCDPSQILFVGDSIFDMQTADNAGMKPLWVMWGYGIYPEGSRYLQAAQAGDIVETFISLKNI